VSANPDQSFDVIVADGRARPACLRVAMPKLKPGGLLVLDNAERPWYARARAMVDAAGWKRKDHVGPGPYNQSFWETVIWQRPE
jgi:predicted O-methyltransferase YrrM